MATFKSFKPFHTKRNLALIGFFLIIVLSILVHTLPIFWDYKTNQLGQEEDIYYLWVEGKRILIGENPYLRILHSNMRDNQKYATYFPLFYILSYAAQLFGLSNYSDWIGFWRYIFLGFNIGVAFLLFFRFYQANLTYLAFFSSVFWLFNRWNFFVTRVVDIDFLPIFFLIASLLLLTKNKWISLILFSFSLAIKQIAIFLLPLYLIWIYQSAHKNAIKQVFIAVAVIISIPLLTSIPFIFWSFDSLVKSVFFSATRNPESDFNAFSFDAYITMNFPGFVGIEAKIPMLIMMALVYLIKFRRQINMNTASLLVMIIFTDFNSVLFNQYMCWIVPLIPLALCDRQSVKMQ